MIDGYILGSRFTMGAVSGTVDHLFFYHDHTGAPDNQVRGAIYTVDGDRPGVLVKETDIHNIAISDGWVQTDFLGTRFTLEAGVEYFLLIWIGESSTSTVRYDVPGGNQGFTRNMGSGAVGNFPTPMTGGAVRSYRFSMYVTYDQILGTVTNDLKGVFQVGQNSDNLKAIFEVGQGRNDLLAEFLLRQITQDLPAELEVRNVGSQDLKSIITVIKSATADRFAKFTVSQPGTQNLFAKFEVRRLYNELYAKLVVRGAATYDVPAKAVIRHSATKDLKAEFIVRHDGIEKDLKAVTTIRHTDTNELYAVFWVGGSADLKATLYISTNPGQPAYYPIIDDGIKYWINYLDLQGRGFIGYPTFEKDDVKVFSGTDSLKISADRVNKGYKEFTFGWLYEPVSLNPINEQPCVPIGINFNRVIREEWNNFEEATVDYADIEKDNYLRRLWLTDFGAGGLYNVHENHGADDTLKIAHYGGYLPGDLSYQWVWSDCIAMMKWDVDSLSGLDLARFAWARIELYRYGTEGGMQGSSLWTDRIPDCQDIDERYANNTIGEQAPYGGCNPELHYTSTGNTPIDIWIESAYGYDRFGDDNMSFPQGGGGRYQYANESFYAAPNGVGLTWEDNVWDKVDLTEMMLGWLNGTYNNHGMFVRMKNGNLQSDFNSYDNAVNYYSRHAAGAYKPKLRVMLQPENLKWTFSNLKHWDINTTDPYSGTACLRLQDWSKWNYQNGGGTEGTTARPSMVLTDEDPKEGYVETAFRLNSDDLTYLKSVVISPFATNVYVTEENTPTENYLNVYFRYQDSNNHYRVEFNPHGTNVRIIRVVNGASTTLNTFNGRFKVGTWYQVRVFWTVNEDGEFKICCFKYDESYDLKWRFLGGALDADNYWPDGGEVRFEGLDLDLDDTEIWEAQ